ncbi:hypothetical protein [Tenacibaculum sp. 190524A02b]|uniref:hypothetical protein n=1 Tax=Tenacibaculum vairaonense TaxID=3137860 RepID=UPI0031FABC91
MSKRFIDLSIHPKAWRKLDPNLKLTWFWLWCNCDASGVWEIDEDYFEFENSFNLNLSSLRQALPNEIEVLNGKLLLKNYIVINYCDFSKLKPSYNPHKPLFRAIKKNNIELIPSLNQACFKLVDEEEDKDEEEDRKGGLGEKQLVKSRKENFIGEVLKFSRYDKTTLEKFYKYWTEPATNGKTLRFEHESFFDIETRLEKWQNFDWNKNTNISKDTPPSIAR